MAKYLIRDSITGELEEEVGIETSLGVPDAGKFPQTDATGRLTQSVMPIGIGADVNIADAFEALSAGDFVNIFNNSGAAGVRKADANSPGKKASGFVLQNYAAGTPATVYSEGTNTQLTGLTPGTNYFLSDTTPGGVTDTPIVGQGKIHQIIGRSVSDTAINFEGSPVVKLK